MKASPLAGKPATPAMLVDVPRLVTAYYAGVPDSSVPAQRVAFGTSGHRGSAFANTFNEWHVLAISQAICDYRNRRAPIHSGSSIAWLRSVPSLNRFICPPQPIA